MRLNKKLVAAGVGTALALALGGVALAYWTTTGAGTGSASNSSGGGAVTLHAIFAPGIAPGQEKAVQYTADNANSYSTKVGALTVTDITADAAHSTCVMADFHATALTENVTVAPGATGVEVGTGVLTFENTAANQDACKGAIVTISLTSA